MGKEGEREVIYASEKERCYVRLKKRGDMCAWKREVICASEKESV